MARPAGARSFSRAASSIRSRHTPAPRGHVAHRKRRSERPGMPCEDLRARWLRRVIGRQQTSHHDKCETGRRQRICDSNYPHTARRVRLGPSFNVHGVARRKPTTRRSDHSFRAARPQFSTTINAPSTCAPTTDAAVEQRSSGKDDGSALDESGLCDSGPCQRRRQRRRPFGPSRDGRHIFPAAWRAYRRHRRRRPPQSTSNQTVHRFREASNEAGAETSSRPL
jgi:hypothetical protein